jgi:hypothetical protein
VGSRFDDSIYWTSLLQLQFIITVHTLNSFLITNLSLYFIWFSDWYLVASLLLLSITHGFLATTDSLLCLANFSSCITLGEPSRVPVLCLFALCWIPGINSGQCLDSCVHCHKTCFNNSLSCNCLFCVATGMC